MWPDHATNSRLNGLTRFTGFPVLFLHVPEWVLFVLLAKYPEGKFHILTAVLLECESVR